MQAVPYLTFDGHCHDAMLFYEKCLGGKLFFQTIGESPLGDQMPKRMKDYILHASLIKDEFTLFGSDMVGESGLIKGNSISISLHCASEVEINKIYTKLAAGGMKVHPLVYNYWGVLLGALTDKYGHHWVLNYNKKQ
jgi:PhnB protein